MHERDRQTDRHRQRDCNIDTDRRNRFQQCRQKLLQTQLYIAVGVATSVAVLVASAFSLQVLVPALSQVTGGIDASLDTRVLNAVNFSKYNANETYVSDMYS